MVERRSGRPKRPSRRRRRDEVFRALADPTRRRILEILREGALPAGELAGHFRTSRPAIAQHVGALKAAGLVSERKLGRVRFCFLDPRPLREIDSWIAQYRRFWAMRLDELKTFLEAGDSNGRR